MLESLTTQRYPRLIARARMLASSDDAAADLVQEALIATFSKPRNFGSLAQAEQYVRRAIVTKYVDSGVKATRERERWARAVDPRSSEPDPADGVTGMLDLTRALQALPPRERACVALRFLEDLSVRETADQLGLSEGAVKRYVSDGIKALNVALGTREPLDQAERAIVRPHPGGTL